MKDTIALEHIQCRAKYILNDYLSDYKTRLHVTLTIVATDVYI